MVKEDLKTQINNLRQELHHHNYNYYILDNSSISDAEFDAKLRVLIDLEKKYPEFFDANSPSQKIGGGITKKFPSSFHKYSMYSLDNVFSTKELLEWEKRILKKHSTTHVGYLCELKYDGASISLFYKNGKFTQAITRGDGTQGDDITANVRTIRNLPLVLKGDFPDELYLRAEIILPLRAFENINKERIKNNLVPYANPRNTASGTLKLQDSAQVAKRPLECLIYEIKAENINVETQYLALKKAVTWGFKIPDSYKLFKNISEIINFNSYWEKEKKNLAYEIDGVVVKVNSFESQKLLGFTSKAPRWAVAYKFSSNKAVSRLKSINFQVGRTGAVTPVAIIEPVFLSGSLIQKASLHNEDNIKKLDLHQNDEVFVEKAGEIIPQIIGVDATSRIAGAKKEEFIKNCPACNTPLVRVEGESAYYCFNKKNCQPQAIGAMIHFVSRKAMDIEGIGKENIKLFYKKGLVRDISDLYILKREDLVNLDRMGEKSAQNAIDGIKNSINIPYSRVLYALGIPHIGYTTAKVLAKEFPSIELLMNASYEEIIAINEIGDKIAKSIKMFFSEEQNQVLIKNLKEYKLQLSSSSIYKDNEKNNTKYLNKYFLFTGKLENYTREEAYQKVEDIGAIVASNINKQVDFLVVGNNPGTKLKKASSFYNIKILTEKDFMDL